MGGNDARYRRKWVRGEGRSRWGGCSTPFWATGRFCGDRWGTYIDSGKVIKPPCIEVVGFKGLRGHHFKKNPRNRQKPVLCSFWPDTMGTWVGTCGEVAGKRKRFG